MSKKQASEKHEEKSPSVNKVVAIIIIFCFIGIMPIVTLWSVPPANPPVATSPPPASVVTAASAAGLSICTTSPVAYRAPGLETASIYQLSTSCGKVTKNNSVFVLVADFSSTNAMNSAIQIAMSQLSNYEAVNFIAFTDGTEVIIVEGVPGNTNVQEMGASLQEQGAVKIAAGS
jgi:hypothetical protein